MRASKASADELLNVFPMPAHALGSPTTGASGVHREISLPEESRLFHLAASAFWRYVLLFVSSFTLSGSAQIQIQ